ncbi:barstar family protein [Nocardia sp. NPDC056000]|uniref:barstar family protein n=1 Tax=Nocardia sp. NPDC056000 TaxID=3345674 RepID=UPI0035D650BA
MHRRTPLPDDPPGTRYELDGTHIVDEDTFYCAIGEAVNGPGGYFGWNLDAFEDCTRGGFGATTPFTIVWNESATARTHLGRRTNRDDSSIFDIIMEICAQHRIEVLLR